ncbi:sensor histidine kinase [Microbacterium sp. No. 7]|uniref:sensor histidine kinase n=1 Tax=Microbacterium sp. No. 7 TaxID=1714373 RepID=UPI0006D056E2|nr:sensor histidine kinase [Microbacterium sp. No. 7]ALJ21320.1 hypothetical protein AOA12_15995 [Microbacterium sp. No. 7]
MTGRRYWWDVTVVGVVLVVGALASLQLETPLDHALCGFVLLLFAVAYAVCARPELGRGFGGGGTWRAPVFVALACVALLLGTAVAPQVATLQAVAYPLTWLISAGRRSAIAASACIAGAVLVGTALAVPGLDGVLRAVITAVLSFSFALAMGLWISSIVEYGEQRAALLAELTAAQGQVEALSRDRGAARERERLARDVHDTLAQSLAGLVILAERAGRQARSGDAQAAAASIATVEDVARDALAEARALVVRTAAVPEAPAFGRAVERLVERFRAEAGLEIELDRGGDASPRGRDAEVVLLRCLQEALANVRKHAGATRARVEVHADADGAVQLAVHDDGRGFDPAAPRDGFGLDGMAERVALAGGSLEIDTAPGRGTVLRVALPGVPS